MNDSQSWLLIEITYEFEKEHHRYLGPNPRGSDLICLSWDLNVNISKAACEILMYSYG